MYLEGGRFSAAEKWHKSSRSPTNQPTNLPTLFEDGLVLHAGELEAGVLQVLLLYPQVERLLKLRAVVVLHNRSLLPLQLLKKMEVRL